MFLDIDKRDIGREAAMDDSGRCITYGDLVSFSGEFVKSLPRRTLIFILAENSIGSLLGYVGALSNHIVPLILSAKTEESLYQNLYQGNGRRRQGDRNHREPDQHTQRADQPDLSAGRCRQLHRR